MASTKNPARKQMLLSRREIEGQIAEGHTLLIVDQKVLKVNAWLKYHPGGDKAIQHMIGRDATDEVNALHSAEARKQMERYQIGVIEGRWKNFLPPIQGGTFRTLIEIDDEGICDQPETESVSAGSSREQSPLFDIEDGTVRERKAPKSEAPRSSSVSSVSSIDADGEGVEGLSYLDARTKKELDLDLVKYPSLDVETQGNIAAKYRILNERIRAEGLYNCNYGAYAVECARYAFFFAMMLKCVQWGWYGTGGFFLGCFWHQLVFTAHDSGHMGITHNFTIDTTIGIIIADFLGGLSLGWWKRSHNVHHIVTNSPEHDPDIEHLPFFAISHRFFQSLRSTYHERIMPYDVFAKFFVQYQAYLYYPVLTLGRFNLYVLSWEYLIRGMGPRKGPAWWHRWFEVAGQVFFWYWFGYKLVYQAIPSAWDRFVFIMISHMVTAPLHVQITLSHFAMSTAEMGPAESFPQKMLRTTMDVDCPQWLDFFHGGLQFQAIHHLYPRIPRHNLRATQKLVQEFCEDVGIPYALFGFVNGNKEVIGRLGDVGRQATIMAKCQKVVAERGDLLHAHHH